MKVRLRNYYRFPFTKSRRLHADWTIEYTEINLCSIDVSERLMKMLVEYENKEIMRGLRNE